MAGNILELRSLDAAQKFPIFIPAESGERKLQSEQSQCEEHNAPLKPILITSLGEHGDPAVAEVHPVAIDGWHCEAGDHFVYPAKLSEEAIAQVQDEAVAAAQSGNMLAAELGFRRVVNSLPEWSQGHANLGSLYLDKIRHEQAEAARFEVIGRYANIAMRHFELALKGEPPAHPMVMLMLARVQVRMGMMEQAQPLLRSFLELEGLPPPVQEEAEELLYEAQRPSDVEYQKGAALVNPYLQLADNRAQDASTPQAQEDLSKGIELLTASTEMHPENWPAFWLIGMAERTLGHLERSHEALNRAHELQPEHGDVARELMAACLMLGKTKEAVEAAQRAQLAAPDDIGLEANLGLALMYDGQDEEALATASSALSRAPEDKVTGSLVQYISDVHSKKRERPTQFPPPRE